MKSFIEFYDSLYFLLFSIHSALPPLSHHQHQFASFFLCLAPTVTLVHFWWVVVEALAAHFHYFYVYGRIVFQLPAHKVLMLFNRLEILCVSCLCALCVERCEEAVFLAEKLRAFRPHCSESMAFSRETFSPHRNRNNSTLKIKRMCQWVTWDTIGNCENCSFRPFESEREFVGTRFMRFPSGYKSFFSGRCLWILQAFFSLHTNYRRSTQL